MVAKKTPKSIYAHCMGEARFRLNYAWERLSGLKRVTSFPGKWIELEIIALQHRKFVELLAFASISVNESEYRRIRENYQKDWNAQRIFRDIKCINANFYPTPIMVQDTEDVQIIDEITDGFLTETDALHLYSRCSGLLHAENRYASSRNLDEDISYFDSVREPILSLLKGFWVRLSPEFYRYIVFVDFSSNHEVECHLARIGNEKEKG